LWTTLTNELQYISKLAKISEGGTLTVLDSSFT
jgi:hypothetical protein